MSNEQQGFMTKLGFRSSSSSSSSGGSGSSTTIEGLSDFQRTGLGLDRDVMTFNASTSKWENRSIDYVVGVEGVTALCLGAGCTMVGDNAIVIGLDSGATGFGLVVGNGSVATAPSSIIFGNFSGGQFAPTGENSTTIGSLASARGEYSTCVGHFSTAGGTGALAVGASSNADGSESLAIGRHSRSGFKSVCIGAYAGSRGTTLNHASVNVGHEAGMTLCNPNVVNVGYRAGIFSAGDSSINIGAFSGAAGCTVASINIGSFAGGTTFTGLQSVNIGNDANCNAEISTSIGFNNRCEGSFNTLYGAGCKTFGSASENVVIGIDASGSTFSGGIAIGSGVSLTSSNQLALKVGSNTLRSTLTTDGSAHSTLIAYLPISLNGTTYYLPLFQ